MNLRLIMLAQALFCLLIIEHVNAAPYTPASPDTQVAVWPIATSAALQKAKAEQHLHPQDPAAIAALANNYLALASMPGQSRLYGLAQATLKPLIDAKTESIPVWMAWAQVLQHQHAFNESLVAIAKVRERDPQNTNANLLAARIYLIQAKPAKARQACLALLGSSDLLTTSTCVLEVTSHQPEKLNESYEQLSFLVKREGFPHDERGAWLAQVLADMALRLHNPKAAEDWLTPQLKNASVNYWSQWAQTQLAQDKAQIVIDTLTPVVLSASEMDDLLLLQLALAEKRLAAANTSSSASSTNRSSTNTSSTNIAFANTSSANTNTTVPTKIDQHKWEKLLAERVVLRERREDEQHANELARYYLDINPQPTLALHWAELHWKNSREYNDEQLLLRAQAAVAAQSASQKEAK